MPTTTIFCPTCDALILDAPRCPACGKWEQPPEPPAERGALAWRATLPAALDGSLTLADGTLYACDAAGGLHAFDAPTGQPRWPQPVALGAWRIHRQVAVAGGLVIVGPRDAGTIPAGDKAVLALEATTGGERWRTPLAARQASDPLVAGDAVYLATYDGQAVALALANGAVRWRAPLPGVCKAAPAAAGDLILFGGDKGLTALRAADGQAAWRFQAPAEGAWGCDLPYPAVCTDGVAYLTCWNGRCYALDAATGEQLWASEPCKRPPMTPPLVMDDAVFFCAHDRYVYCLECATGARRWRTQLPARSQTTPVVLEGSVFVLSQDHKLYALDAASGALGGEPLLETVRRVEGDWASDGLHAYAGDADGQLYAVLLRARPQELNPDLLAAQGKWPEAAARYALAGALVRAAEIYAGQLTAPRHAALLYERADEKLLAAAQFEAAGDLKAARGVYAGLGQHERVAELSVALGDLPVAAQAYERANRWEQAADIYARLGAAALPQTAHAFERAAETASQQGQGKTAQEYWFSAAEAYKTLRQPEKAVQLYHRAGRRDRVDYVIRETRDPALKVILLRLVTGPEELARWFSEQGQYAAAAEEFVRLKQPIEAGRMYEQAKEYVLAAEQYRAAGQWADAGRMMEAANVFGEAASLYLKAGDRPRAAAVYARQTRWPEAARLYEELEDWAAAAHAWAAGGELDQAAEAWERGGEFARAAAAWQKLGACDRAAEGYWQAAQAAQARKEPRETVAALYDQAMQGFEECGKTQRAAECDAVRRYLRKQPLLRLHLSSSGEFTEGQSGKLQVAVRNEGWSQASGITFKVTGSFEIDLEMAAEPFGLSPDVPREVPLYVVPRRAGSALPLYLTATYTDAHGAALPPLKQTFDVTVRGKDERRGDSTPHNVFYGPAQVIQSEQVGDVVGGDKLAVDIRRQAAAASGGPAGPTGTPGQPPAEVRRVQCMNCGESQPADRFKCTHCGMPLAR